MARAAFILASASPRRRALLHEHGYSFRVEPAGIDECAPRHLTVAETVLFNAKLKADAVASRHRKDTVLGVDTLVALNDRILGKPRNRPEALRMLTMLSGREHQVYSGVWLAVPMAGKRFGFVERSLVRFRPLSRKEIQAYVETVDTLDKAGAYAAQDDPFGIIAAIEGSRTNVIGLPMERLIEEISRLSPGC